MVVVRQKKLEAQNKNSPPKRTGEDPCHRSWTSFTDTTPISISSCPLRLVAEVPGSSTSSDWILLQPHELVMSLEPKLTFDRRKENWLKARTKKRTLKFHQLPNKNKNNRTSGLFLLRTDESLENNTLVGAIISPSACRAFNVDISAFVYNLDKARSQTKFLETTVKTIVRLSWLKLTMSYSVQKRSIDDELNNCINNCINIGTYRKDKEADDIQNCKNSCDQTGLHGHPYNLKGHQTSVLKIIKNVAKKLALFIVSSVFTNPVFRLVF